MKKCILLFLMATLNLVAQDFKTPVDYLSYLGKEQQAIARSTWKYTSAVAHSTSARRIEATRKQLVKSIQVASKKIEALKNGYKGDVEFRDKVLNYLYFAEKNINEEYSKIIDMQEVAQQSYDFMEAYIMTRDLVNKKLDDEMEKVKLAQSEFAQKYNITLTDEESELGKKIKISNEVFDYHSVLYLIFFKVNITDFNLSKAIESKDLVAIEQNASSLGKYADEGLEKIKTLSKYKNDASLLDETKKTLLYYKNVAEEYTPKVVAYLMFYDKFENAKKTLEAKSENDRTKEEVDNYNSMVKQVNKEIANYNKLSSSNFQDRTNTINAWNGAADDFIARHVPQD
ncbi:LIC11966 family surface protein [Flavobacterium sp.]|uniref:LIC11966 family surface protein n=1 Tax=Flavobacterium sp. TaxID=239 RepID=UPI002B4AD8F9|nr:hypothetical protein [Flavobacterium sp.]HLP63077.1 hypothetical protein [Flavobacterium sp.]